MSVLGDALRIAADSKVVDALWERIVGGREPAKITLADLLTESQLNRMRRAAALDRARTRGGRP